MNRKNFQWLIGSGRWQVPPPTPTPIEGGDPTPVSGAPVKPATLAPAKTFTQEEVDALIGKVRGEGRKKGADSTAEQVLAALKEKGLEFKTLEEVIEHAASAPTRAKTDAEKIAALEKEKADLLEAQAQIEEAAFFDEMQEAVATACQKLAVDEKEYATVWAVLQTDEQAFLNLIEQFDADKGFVGLEEKITALVKEHPQWQAPRQKLNNLGTPRLGDRTGVVPTGNGQLPPVDRFPIKANL